MLIFQPDADTRRPAYAVCIDDRMRLVVWGFRGTTDLEVSHQLQSCCLVVFVSKGKGRW